MSCGTSLTILKNDNIKCSSSLFSTIKKDFFEKNKEFYNHLSNNKQIFPLYLSLDQNQDGDENDEKFVNSDTLQIFSSIINIQFCSSFMDLAEYFNINPYKNYQIELDKYQIKLLLQSIDYIIDGRFDERFEQILDNNFISFFGKNNKNYCLFKNPDEEFDLDFDNTYSLKQFKTILDMFLLLQSEEINENKYKLIFSCW